MGISFWCPLRSWNPNLAMVLELRAGPAWTSFHKSVPLSILSTQYGRKIRVISQNSPEAKNGLSSFIFGDCFTIPNTQLPFLNRSYFIKPYKSCSIFLTHMISFAFLWHWLVSSKVYNDKRLALNTSQLIKNNLGLLGAFLVIDLLLWRVDHGQCYSSFLPCKSFSY